MVEEDIVVMLEMDIIIIEGDNLKEADQGLLCIEGEGVQVMISIERIIKS